jgi:hypothetical protein
MKRGNRIMKKLILFAAILLLLTSCSKQINTVEPDVTEPVTEPEEDNETEPVRYTGEIITDGFYGNSGRIYFVPDKETRELLKNEYPFSINAGESIPLDYEGMSIVENLPRELGIYKVEVDADYNTGNIFSKLKAINLTEEIGTVEYEGKEYPTNELDETVNAKDRVCGLIVSNVRKFDDGGAMIEFEGEIESEGFYNVFPGGEIFEYKRLGRIVPDGESLKNFPSYKGTGVENNFSVFFIESNELYQKLAEHSAIGRGKFKTIGYDIVYNFGGGVYPKEELTEIISLDENYKGMFAYDNNSTTMPLANEETKYKAGFMGKYAIILSPDKHENGNSTVSYYFLGYDELSKIKIPTLDGFYYRYEGESGHKLERFKLITVSDSEKPHSIDFKYFDKNSSSNGKDSLWINYNYGYFRRDNEIVTIFEGDSISGMTAEDIDIVNICTEDSIDEFVRVTCNFTGVTTLTGKLNLYFDEGYGYNQLEFIADEESINKLPIHNDGLKEQGWIHFDYESAKELVGEEPFEKTCEITIDNYIIAKSSYTSSVDTADLISVKFLE